ncbi:MAG: exopolyphosphatase [Arcobacter sp.]|nr:MAG: exopolyphosphatase [Arcobacter sp.]
MQNNRLFKQMYTKIKNAHYILIVTHKNPDADTISSALALSNFFYEEKIKHKVFNVSQLPRKLNFLLKFDKISHTIPKYYDLIIYMDCANASRVGKLFPSKIDSISVDHHQSNDNFANMNIVDSSKGSTAELLYQFFNSNNLAISKNIAECLYVGIYDDSLAFTTPRTNSKTFEVVSDLLKTKINVAAICDNLTKRQSLAKFRTIPKIMNTLDLFAQGQIAIVHLDEKWLKETGADINECDDIVDIVLSLGIVRVVAYLRVIESKIRVSLRSKDTIDVSLIAGYFQGGGHKNSAGLSIDSTNIEESKEKIVRVILNYI